MRSALLGSFVALHGLVHLWYVVLAQRLVEYQPEMGWTGESWLLGGTLGDDALRTLATAMYALATVALVGSGAGLALSAAWARAAVAVSAVFSTAVIVTFWDGGSGMLVQKGLLGVAINVGLVSFLLLTD